MDAKIFTTRYCTACAVEITSVLKRMKKSSNLSIILIAGPITSEVYEKLSKLILSQDPSPKLIGIGHCVIGSGVWPYFDNRFLKDLPSRLNIEELIAGCPPHPMQIEENLNKYY
ncbi:MAG: hypothetical protein ACFFAU_21170 [Candidatus Hodarchaeota archaeon]